MRGEGSLGNAGGVGRHGDVMQKKLEPTPCPWCEEEPVIAHGFTGRCWIECRRHSDGHVVSGPVRTMDDEAIKAWNKRRDR